jgi:hypothetical protein
MGSAAGVLAERANRQKDESIVYCIADSIGICNIYLRFAIASLSRESVGKNVEKYPELVLVLKGSA